MLMPKRVKWRKQMRGRMRGKALRGAEVSFGEFGLQALEPGWVTARQIEAGRIAATHFLHHEGRVYIRIFPHKPVTAIAAESRMGNGKGEPEFWCAEVKPGTVVGELGLLAPGRTRTQSLVALDDGEVRVLPYSTFEQLYFQNPQFGLAFLKLTSQRLFQNIARLEEVPGLIGDPQEVVAAVLMHMLGDLTGRTLLLFPEPVGRQLCDMLLKRPLGTTKAFETIEQSCLKEAGNILSGAYMNALSEFMGMLLLPSVPSLVVDLSAAVLTTTYLNFGHDRDFVFCVETEFNIDAQDGLRGHFLLLPDLASLKAIFDAIRLT